jgi:hypothetical protein
MRAVTPPQVLRLELRLDDPAKVSEETMKLKVELWRADLITSIVALDASGIICPLEMEAAADLYPSGWSCKLCAAPCLDSASPARSPAIPQL